MGRAGSISNASSLAGGAEALLASGSDSGWRPRGASEGTGAMKREAVGDSCSLSIGKGAAARFVSGSERLGRDAARETAASFG